MILNGLDWTIITLFFVISLGIGLYASRSSGKNTKEFFLAGRNMPWWLLGISMVATTFSADTPNLVTQIVRENGVSGNWVWWAFLLTGMLTVFVYAKLWQRSKVLTDLEFYEIRYSGQMATLLRGFRAIYLGVFFNIMIMATVCLAVIQLGAVMLQWSPVQTLLVTGSITLVYSVLGGLKGVLLTDFFQFFLAMIGSLGAVYILVNMPDVGGLEAVLSHPNVIDKRSILPDFSDSDALWMLLILPLAVQWWNVWYPGAEPGGGGYIAQRMLSAKSESDAIGATFLFNVAHYALRPWPWICIALASLVVFPTVDSLKAAFPQVDPSIIGNDFAYPAMLSFLPHGFLGLVTASLIAAFMSTMSTHLNWGASYVINDYYKRFVRPNSTEEHLVRVGRISMCMMMLVAGIIALALSSMLQAFQILLQIGAGTGLLFILRWFWWRINAYSELTAMGVSFLVALYFAFVHGYLFTEPISSSSQLLIGIFITTCSWVFVTLKTAPVDINVLASFYQKVRPGGIGWKSIREKIDVSEMDLENDFNVPQGILCMVLGCISVFGTLFATGYFLYEEYTLFIVATSLVLLSTSLLTTLWKKIK